MANSHHVETDRDDESVEDRTATNCVGALNNIIRLSKMSAATREAVDHLQDLTILCAEANAAIAEIKTTLADDDETVEDPVRVAEILGRLNQISQAVHDVNQRSDDRIVQFRTATG